MSREIELTNEDESILEALLTHDNVAKLLNEYEESTVRDFMEKVGLDFPEELTEDEEDEDEEEEADYEDDE